MNTISNGYSEIGNRSKTEKKIDNYSNRTRFERVYKEKLKNNETQEEFKSYLAVDEKHLLKEDKVSGSICNDLLGDLTISYQSQHQWSHELILNNAALEKGQINMSIIDAVEVITEILHKVSISNVGTLNIYKTTIFLPNIGDIKLEINKNKKTGTFVKLKKTQSESSVTDVDLHDLKQYLENKGVDCSIG
jgi:hypothetical protein